jgi:class 3 adenylate cyclase
MSTTAEARGGTTLADWLGVEPGEPTQMTLLFTDIVGSTKAGAKLGDKDWIERLLRHFDQGLRLITEYDGYKIKFVGDSFMAAFKSPVNALRFATAFHKETGDELIRIRACVHSGTARVVNDDVFGQMVNYAARLLGWTEDGVVVSNAVKEDLDGEYGSQRAKEVFVRQSADLKDFGIRPVWAVNLEEWWVTRIKEDIPDVSEACGADCGQGCLLRPATPEDIGWVADLQARTYERDAVPAYTLGAWYRANPHGFSIMEKDDGEMLGYVGILPLKPSAVALLLDGTQAEGSITSEMLYASDERSLIRTIYIESIIVKDKYKELQLKAFSELLTNFGVLLGRVCDVDQVGDVYHIPATEKSERLIHQLGFKLLGLADERVDKHPLYVAALKDVRFNIESMLSAARAQ